MQSVCCAAPRMDRHGGSTVTLAVVASSEQMR
jgi:hypothetical protein